MKKQKIKIEQINLTGIEDVKFAYNPFTYELIGEWEDGLYITVNQDVVMEIKDNIVVKVYEDEHKSILSKRL